MPGLETLKKDVSFKLSLYGMSMAYVYLFAVAGDAKEAVRHLLNAEGQLDDALDILNEATEKFYAAQGEAKAAKAIRRQRYLIAKFKKVTKELMDEIGVK